MARVCPIAVLAITMATCACSRHSSSPVSVSAANSVAAPATRSAFTQVNDVAPTTQKTVLVAASQPEAAPNVVASDQTLGPFHVGGQTFTFVRHVQTIGEPKPGNDSTVEWWELRDDSGKAVYRVNYGIRFQNGTFEETEDVDARELKTKFGQGILVQGMSLPSAPDSGSWVQVFGLFNGKLVPFSSPISTEGEFLQEAIDTFQPSTIFKGQQPQPVSRDVLNFRMWTGNFNITYAVAIDWMQAQLHPAWTCMGMTSKGPLSACRYKVDCKPAPRTDLTFVRLFNEPDGAVVPKHVVIKPESKIEFIEGEMEIEWVSDAKNTTFGLSLSTAPRSPEKVWLHIRVDGQDGWISGDEDFDAVGLPQAG